MSAEQRGRIPFLGGRNYIESIVYTLTYLGFQARLATGRENLTFIVVELERQLCGLARAIPQVKVIYHEYVKETLREAFRDYPLPELGPACPVRDTLLSWMDENKDKIFGDELDVVSPDIIRKRVQATVDAILHQAIMGTLYKAGVLTHA